MAITKFDGVVATTKTPTPTNHAARDAAKASAATPSSTSTKSPATTLARTPVVVSDALSIKTAVAKAGKGGSSKPKDAAKSEKIVAKAEQAHVRAEVKAAKAEAKATAKANGYHGKASEKVEKLDGASNGVAAAQATTKRDQGVAEAAARKQQKAEDTAKLEAGAKTAQALALSLLNPVAAGISALFGAGPVADAVKANEKAGKTKDKREDALDDVRAANQEALRLSRYQERISESLDTARDVNTLVQTAHATGMPESVVQALDAIDSTNFSVQKSTGVNSDAAYDDGSKKVIVDSEVMDDVSSARRRLTETGAMTENGFVIEASAIRDTSKGKELISTSALVNHEFEHAAQDRAGVLDAADKATAQTVETARKEARESGATPEETKAIVAAAESKAADAYLEAVEYTPNLNQELNQIAAGKKPEVYIMVNPDGSQLPKAQQLQNLKDYYASKPLSFGESEGMVVTGGTSDSNGQVTEFWEDPSGRRHPGRRHPGRRHP
ncbi:MAG: hypothetical protein JWO69_1639 [Thermoleophilia bacterium]|jgi:hypothetical protein|nr:hypothetical protein [Thermoleophilia bacterium]